MKVYKIVTGCPEIEEILGGDVQYVDVEENGEFFRIVFQITYDENYCYGGATFLSRSKKFIGKIDGEPLFETSLTVDELMTEDVYTDWISIAEDGGYYPWASVEICY